MEVYEPREDSYFFAYFLKGFFSKLKNKDIKYLDLGCGSGILSEVAIECGIKNIFASDINPDAVVFVKKKNINAIVSDLFSDFKKEKFDIITFNAPYLPNDKREPIDSSIITGGGKRGDEISVKFVKDSLKHLNENGKIFLLVSSLAPLNRLKKFGFNVVAKKRIFYEDLILLEFEKNNK